MSKQLSQLSGSAVSEPQIGEKVCANTDSHAHVAKASDAVSPAISQALSPSTDENYTTESDGNKPCNQSGGESPPKPDCYKCKWRRPTEFSHHSKCAHPVLAAVPGGEFLSMFFTIKNLRSPFAKRINMTYNEYGYANGWCFWPIDFDPVWIETCDGFEKRS